MAAFTFRGRVALLVSRAPHECSGPDVACLSLTPLSYVFIPTLPQESDDEEAEKAEEDGFEKVSNKVLEKKKDAFFAKKPEEITWDMVDRKLQDIVLSRGRKGTDRREAVEHLTFLATVAKGPAQQVEANMHAVSAMFDINPSMSTHMPVALWHKAACTLLRIFKLLSDNPNVTVQEVLDQERTDPANLPADAPQVVPGNLTAFVERLVRSTPLHALLGFPVLPGLRPCACV